MKMDFIQFVVEMSGGKATLNTLVGGPVPALGDQANSFPDMVSSRGITVRDPETGAVFVQTQLLQVCATRSTCMVLFCYMFVDCRKYFESVH